jgi:hypothetical protein
MKKVTFNLPAVAYYFPDVEDRRSHWEQFVRDRARFKRRIDALENLLRHVLLNKIKSFQ